MNLGEKDVATPMKSLQGVVLFLCSLFPVLTAAQDLPGVQLETVSSEDIVQEVTLNGTVNALRVSGMSAAVAGLLDEVRVETGDRVSRGDVLRRPEAGWRKPGGDCARPGLWVRAVILQQRKSVPGRVRLPPMKPPWPAWKLPGSRLKSWLAVTV